MLVDNKDLLLKLNVGNFINDSDYLKDNYFLYSFIISGKHIEVRKFIQYLNSLLEFPFIRHRFNGNNSIPIRDADIQKVITEINIEQMNSNQKGIEKYLDHYDNSQPLYFLQIKTRFPLHTEAFSYLKGFVNYNIRLRQVTADWEKGKTDAFQGEKFDEIRFKTGIWSSYNPFLYNIPRTYYSSNYGLRTEDKTPSFRGMKEFWIIEKTSHSETQNIRIHNFELTKMSFVETEYYSVGQPIYQKIPFYDKTCDGDVIDYVDPVLSQYNGFKASIDIYTQIYKGYLKAVNDTCESIKDNTCKQRLSDIMSGILDDLLIMLTFSALNYIKPNIRYDGINAECIVTKHPVFNTFLVHKSYIHNFTQDNFYHIIYQNLLQYSYMFFREYCYWSLQGAPHMRIR